MPLRSDYAQLLWLEEEMEKLPVKVVCRTCGATAPPGRLIVEWDEGSDRIADFTNAVGAIVTKEAIADELMARFKGLAKRKIEFFDHPDLRRPAPGSRRAKEKRVWLPYQGPPLCELVFTHTVGLLEQSTVEIESVCPACGRIVYASIEGIEEYQGPRRRRRKRGAGFFVSPESLAGHEVFRPRDTLYQLCTTGVRKFIEQRKWTNIEFLEAGEIVR